LSWQGETLAKYHFLTTWRIESPLESVYAAILDSMAWPDWWPSVRKVEQTARGQADGIGNVRRYAWEGKLPYRVVFQIRATRIDRLAAIEGTARGDLSGVGRWKFSRQGKVSVVRYEWNVRSNRWWMNLVAPVARQIFIRNHTQIMEQGGKALARLLNARLVGQEHIDLMSVTGTAGYVRGRTRQRGRT
jgi:hypothetical protein